ncbi:MAG: DUF1932 domain-containing protein, partial [Pseudomonadota bacterium]
AGTATPMVISGPAATELADLMISWGMSVQVVGDDVRAAAALKIVRSYGLKAISIATYEMIRAAHLFDIEEAVLASSADFLGWPGYPDWARTVIASTAIHAGRRAQEMEEVMETIEDAKLDPTFARAVRQAFKKIESA